jgi:hypothetical protein
MSNRLANGLVGTTIGAARSGRVVDQGSGTLIGKGVAELEVALLTVAEKVRRLLRAQAQALPGDEHGELASDLVVAGDR